MNIQNTFAAGLLALAFTGSAPGAVTLFAEYHLGEAGAASLGTDSTAGGRHINSTVAGGGAVATASPSPVSSTYMDTVAGGGNEGRWLTSGSFSGLTDNYAFAIWARAASTASGVQGSVFSLGNDGMSIALGANGWTAGVWNSSSQTIDTTNFLGTAGGSGFSANTWVSLAVIRQNGVSTFYIDGIAQSGTLTAAGANGTGYLSMNPNANGNIYDGFLDEGRIVTFAGTDSTASILSGLNAVPEPSVALLGGLSALLLLRRRRD